jgi:transcriptional regulator with XRE-family HTH domain
MPASFVFDGLKAHFKARGMTYADVARALKVSEPTVKRIFATRNCTLARLDSLCELAQVDLADLARGLPRADRLINRLTHEQEEELIRDPALLLVAVAAIHQLRLDEIVRVYRFDEAQCVKLLLRLEKLGILELHERNRIRLLLSRTFSWIPGGPIMRYVISQAADFFDHPFDAPGEVMRVLNLRISKDAQVALLRQMEQLAREYAEQAAADAHLPLDQRPALSVLFAARAWWPRIFKGLGRQEA